MSRRRNPPRLAQRREALFGPRRGALLIGALLLIGESLSMVASGAVAAATVSSWSTTGSLSSARFGATATVLKNGEVLIAGGATGSRGAPSASNAAGLYDPTKGTVAATGALGAARFDASAARLDNGKVLVVGGLTGSGAGASASHAAELYDPATGTFSAAHDLAIGVFGAGAVTLPTGDVLVVGGDTGTFGAPVSSAVTEQYDPATNAWTELGALATARAFASTTLLANGDVLVAGGRGGSGALGSAERFATDTSTWSSAGSMPGTTTNASAALLANGSVLVAGGENSASTPLPSSFEYAPTSNSWSTVGSLTVPRRDASAVTLPNGEVLVAGGVGISGSALSSSEVFDPTSNKWSATATMPFAAAQGVMAPVAGGDILFAGGFAANGAASSAAATYFAGLPPTFSSAANANFLMGTVTTFTVRASGSPTPLISESGTLPAGLRYASSNDGTATISGIASGPVGPSTVQLTAINGVSTTTQTLTLSVIEPASPGYLVVDAAGRVYPYGLATSSSSLSLNPRRRPVVVIRKSIGDTGYYIVTKLGNIYNVGGAPFYGSEAAAHLSVPVTAFAVTPDGKGYWLGLANGTVYSFGDAHAYSSLSLNAKVRPLVSIAPTSDGKGYWLVTKLGNVYNFGDAGWFGSKARVGLAASVTSFARTADGQGYWLGLANGVVFPFGSAATLPGMQLNKKVRPLVSIVPTLDSNGYYLVTKLGNVYNFGDATWHGSPVHLVHRPSWIVSAAIPD